jgi:beta-glucosidase
VHYGEGIFVGYRYYEKKELAPQFPFGYGLSYTQFAMSNLQINKREFTSGETIELNVDVQNVGQRTGQEVVQVYVCDVEARLVRPYKELKAFAKVTLQPGATQTVTFTLDETALAYYDPAKSGWVAESGEFELLIGNSSQNILLSGAFHWHGNEGDDQTLDKSARLHVGLPWQEILADPAGKAVLEKHFPPDVLNHPHVKLRPEMTLEQLSAASQMMFSQKKLMAVNKDLATQSG